MGTKSMDRSRGLLTSWTFRPDCSLDDAGLKAIDEDLQGKGSILELFAGYMEELRGNPDNDAPPFKKMAKLFESGMTPDRLEGHFYGVPLCFRTGDQEPPLSSIGNVLEILWDSGFEGQSPWAGKSFSPLSPGVLNAIVPGPADAEEEAFLGINHFNKIPLKVANNASFPVLNILMRLEIPSPEERLKFGHDKEGCNFIARQGNSVGPDPAKRVFQLNYRWKNLNNLPPMSWLIDELTQIGEGLYLGQLMYATDRLLDQYDPESPVAGYRYRNFGYFLLFDERWNREARRLFPFLQIPENAPGMVTPSAEDLMKLPRFSTFLSGDGDPAPRDDALYGTILADMKDKPTIMHLLKDYSDRLQGSHDNDSPLFRQMQEIFVRGTGVEDMAGYYRGALVSWHSEGVFKLFDVNTLNLAWTGLAMKFSTWTGKSFEAVSKERIEEITDGYESGHAPTRWGSNTQSLRTFKERFVGNITGIAQVWNEPVSQEEILKNGYDMKNFFFIAHQAPSINPACGEKTVYQLNYRWPNLKTIIPDRYCIDEVVKIAEGLYLGQLMYAVNVALPYDPHADPAAYEYRNFGFFLLMDEEWHRIRLKIGFDLTNA